MRERGKPEWAGYYLCVIMFPCQKQQERNIELKVWRSWMGNNSNCHLEEEINCFILEVSCAV